MSVKKTTKAKKAAKTTRKRYTLEEKTEILNFVREQGRGGQNQAIKKFGVTAATIAAWRRSGGQYLASLPIVQSSESHDISKQIQIIRELEKLAGEIAQVESHLTGLKKHFDKLKESL